MVEAGIEAQLIDDVVAFRLGARDTDDPAAPDLGDLANHRANRAGSCGDHQRLAGLRPADLQQAGIIGHAPHAEHPQRRRDRGLRRVDLADRVRLEQRKVLPAAIADDEVAGREAVEVGFDHLAHRAAGHHLADRDRRRVRRRVAHAAAHVGIERQIDGAGEQFARPWLRRRALLEPEVVRSRPALRPLREDDAAVDLAHLGPPREASPR
jgi:hypothetical protein